MYTRVAHTFRIIRQTLGRYPLVLASALLFLLAVQGLINDAYGTRFVMIKIAFTGSLGISLCFAIAILGQRNGRSWNWLGNVLAIGFLLVFYFYVLPDAEKHFTEKYLYILVPTYILSHLLVSIAPFLPPSRSRRPFGESTDAESSPSGEQRFWHYNKTLFVNLFLTGVFTGVWAGGTQLALLAMNHLFNLDWDELLYVRVFFTIAIFGSVFIFALFHSDGLEKMEHPTPYPVMIQFFTQFVLVPLLLLYASILYVYGVKILIDWQLPRGWVSYLVLAYGSLGILALLLIEPLLRDGGGKSWVGWFRRLFYYSLLPLLVLLFAAIGTRIGQYGVTEARYFVLLLALWLTFVCLYFILAHTPALRIIPISLFLAGTAALVVPMGNAYAVSVRSQQRAVLRLLTEHDLLVHDTIQTDSPVTSTVVSELQNKYTYLDQRQRADFIRAMLDSTQIEQLRKPGQNFQNLFTAITYSDRHLLRRHFEIIANPSATDISSYNVWVRMEHQEEIRFAIEQDSLILRKTLNPEGHEFSLTANGEQVDLLLLIDDWIAKNHSGAEQQTVGEIAIPLQIGRHEGILLLDRIIITRNGDDQEYFMNTVNLFF